MRSLVSQNSSLSDPQAVLETQVRRGFLWRVSLIAGLGGMPSTVTVAADDIRFTARVRIDTPMEAEYYRHGGILQYVLRQMAR